MSTTDDNTLDDGGLNAEEQAQFDAMRSSGSNIDSPSQLVDPLEQPAATTITPVADATLAPEPALQGEQDDPDVETIKDASGADVLDAKTGKPQKRVSFHKYQRLEQRYNELELKQGKTAEERARIDERLKIINEALTTPAPAEPEVDQDPRPDPEVNIFEYVKWQERQLDREREARTNLEQSWKDERDEGQMASSYRQDANRFASSEPNFGRAYHFLLSLRQNQLKAGGWTDQTKIDQQIVKEERGLVRNALKENASPAQRLFEMAKAAGFTPLAPEPAAQPLVPGTPLGEVAKPAAAAAAAKPAIPSVSEQVALAAKGAEAALSLSNAGGAPVEQLTAAKLLAMDPDDFDYAVAGLSKTKLREIFGD
jgi:hypothetical protein